MTLVGNSPAATNLHTEEDEKFDVKASNVGAMDESEFTQTQMEFTQLTQSGLTPDESSNLPSTPSMNHTPLSPPPTLPYGRLVPCVPSSQLTAVDLMPTQESYWLGRSQKCDITAMVSAEKTGDLSEKELVALEWGKSMISNRHCRIFQQNNGSQLFIEDNSGNGTFINQSTHLRKGETRILHSGDEICLINTETLRKRIPSYRIIELVAQQFSFIVVQSKPRKSCVNPRAMNYHAGRNNCNSPANGTKPPSSTSPIRRIESFYDLREILGDGTSGQVRRAIHRQSGQERAVKIISLRRHGGASQIEREVNLLKSLDHPYIVKLVEVFVQPGVAIYLVMELVKGGDLYDCIVEKQRYTEIEARRAMRRLLSAVYYLHEESNIVHRDLKPENILCASPTDVKLADFGLAKIIKADGLKTFCGTPAYFAPEVLQRRGTVAGQGRYGKPADIWSLGVILYILLTGKPPFDADMDESSKDFDVDFDSDAEIWAQIPDAKRLVQEMLREDPKHRFTVRQACEHTWINVEDGDSHCHPLDDPVVAATRSISGSNSTSNRTDDGDSKETASLSSDGDDSTCSNVVRRSSSEDECNEMPLPDARDQNVTERQEFAVKDLNASADVSSPTSNQKEGNDTDRGLGGNPKNENDSDLTEVNNNASNTDGSLKIANDNAATSSSSQVDCELSRSPLTKLNLNQRSNNFRDQIIKQAKGNFESPNRNKEHQTAVTPTLSNVKRQLERAVCEGVETDGNEDDPIYSQFSSELSSVESFSDCSINDDTKVEDSIPYSNPNKRQAKEEKTAKETKPSKRQKVASPKQTTLNGWLVKRN